MHPVSYSVALNHRFTSKALDFFPSIVTSKTILCKLLLFIALLDFIAPPQLYSAKMVCSDCGINPKLTNISEGQRD
jgi:hypothetical protein